MNVPFKTERSKRLILRAPFREVLLSELLPNDADVTGVDVISVRIMHNTGKEYQLKPGYKLRALSGSRVAATHLAEDFLADGKRVAGNFEIGTSLIVGTSGASLSTASTIANDSQNTIEVTAVEVSVLFTSATPSFNGVTLPASLPIYNLRAPVYAVEVESVSEPLESTGNYAVTTNPPLEGLELDAESAERMEIEPGKVLVFTGSETVVCLDRNVFEQIFTSPNNPVRNIDPIERRIAEMV